MFNTEKSKNLILSIIILSIPFLEFIKNNYNEVDVIVGKSFYILIIFLIFLLIFTSYTIKFFLRKLNFFDTFLISTIIYWIFFKHNVLSLSIKNLFRSSVIGNEFSSEISLILLLLLSIIISIFIYKKNIFFKRFIYIFFLISLVSNLFQILYSKKENKIVSLNEDNRIIFSDKKNNQKENIYFIILDAMQPIEEFEKNYNMKLDNFITEYEKKDYINIKATRNLYDNTTYNLSAFFLLDEIFNEEGIFKEKAKVLFPTLLREKNKPDLIYNLEKLGYEFKWIGNFFAYCPKFNLSYCLNQNQNQYIDTYLYINFFRQSPLIQISWSVASFFDYDFDKYFFYKLNDGMGRLVKNLENRDLNKPTFYFVHHMSPHWPYITDENCSYKKYHGEENFEGYKSAYLCNLKNINTTIDYIEKNDPNSFVVFQADHNWQMSKTQNEKKLIFNLIKNQKNCDFKTDQNLDNVNTLRLIFSCITGNKVQFINF